MLKKPVDVEHATRASLEAAMKCGECLHFKNLPLRKNKVPCHLLGVRAFAVAPKCYTPDVSQLQIGAGNLVRIALLFQSMNSKQKRILMATLKLTMGQSKFKFGERVYLKPGREYVQNYLSANVIGTTSSKTHVITCGEQDLGRTWFGYLEQKDLLTFQMWKDRRAKLVKEGKLVDPKAPKKKGITETKLASETFEPPVPTIDSGPKENKENKPKKKGVKDTYETLTIR